MVIVFYFMISNGIQGDKIKTGTVLIILNHY